MSKFMIILLTAEILATGCADQPIEMNGAAALDFPGLDTGALDTGDTGFDSSTDPDDGSTHEGGMGGFIQKKAFEFNEDEIDCYSISDEPLDELCPR